MPYQNKPDPYHNPLLDTASLLEQSLRNRLGTQDPELVSKNMDAEQVLGDDAAATYGDNMNQGTATIWDERAAMGLEELRQNLIHLFREASANDRLSRRIEGVIRQVEGLEECIGLEHQKFDALINMSGLQVGGRLENAEKVISNTTQHYKMFPITSMTTDVKGGVPTISIVILGEKDDTGFEITGTIVAPSDFDGNEAIDYVYSQTGGLMTVKAKSAGSWSDVSDRFQIQCSMRRYRFGASQTNEHYAFLGENIISEGKEDLLKVLKTKPENLRFGKCRVFSRDATLIRRIKELVRVN